MERLKKFGFWFCLALSIPGLVVAQSEARSDRTDPLLEFLAAIGMFIPSVLYWLAAAWILTRRGIALAFAASLASLLLVVIAAFYEVGLEAAFIIYAVGGAFFGVSLFRRSGPAATSS